MQDGKLQTAKEILEKRKEITKKRKILEDKIPESPAASETINKNIKEGLKKSVSRKLFQEEDLAEKGMVLENELLETGADVKEYDAEQSEDDENGQTIGSRRVPERDDYNNTGGHYDEDCFGCSEKSLKIKDLTTELKELRKKNIAANDEKDCFGCAEKRLKIKDFTAKLEELKKEENRHCMECQQQKSKVANLEKKLAEVEIQRDVFKQLFLENQNNVEKTNKISSPKKTMSEVNGNSN